MGLSDAIRRLFSVQTQAGTAQNTEPDQMQIVDVERVPTRPIPAPTHHTGKTDWLSLLEIPYERWDVRTPQVRDEVHKMYVALAEYIDAELRDYDTSLWELRNKLNQSYDYYSNILYTIYCIAEGEVTSHYKPSSGYDNAFSYELLEKRTDSEFCVKVRHYAKMLSLKLPKPNAETCAAYHLTPNGFEMVWWDMDGSLREKHKLSETHVNLLNKTPARTTNILQVSEVRAYVLMQYMTTLSVLKTEFQSSSGWSKKMSAYLNSFFNGVSFYQWDYDGDFRLLGYILKLCEQTIRENVPYTRLLKTAEETAHIKRVLPKEVAEKILQKATTLVKPISLSEETIESLRKQNPHAWKKDVAELGQADIEKCLKILNYYYSDEEFYRVAKEAIKQSDDKEPSHLLAFYAYYSRLPADKEDFATKRKLHQLITHPEQQKKFDALVSRKLPLSLELVRELEVLTKPPVRTVKLDHDRLSTAHGEHEEALKKVSSYLGEDKEPEQAPVSNGKNTISMDDLFSPIQDDSELDLSSDQLEFLKIIVDNDWDLPVDQAEAFVKSKHKLVRGFVQDLNKSVYEHIEDQLLVQSDDKITVDEAYKNFVKEILNGRNTA